MNTPEPVSFTYTYADYKVLNRLMRRDSLWKRTQYIRVPLFAAVLVVSIAVFLGSNPVDALQEALATWQLWAFLAAIFPFIALMNEIELRLFYRRQRIDRTQVLVSFDDERGITTESTVGLGTLPWKVIRKIVSDADAHVILYENRAIGLCLPRRAFGSQQAFDDAAVYVNSHILLQPSA
jgi:hypothetical protein